MTREEFLRLRRKEKISVYSARIWLGGLFFFIWELFARLGIMDVFVMSCPTRILKTIGDLYASGRFWSDIFFTLFETSIGFLVGTFLGIFIAAIMWWFPKISKILDPYLVIFNAMPKVAFGPIIIVWLGAGITSIIVMALLVSVTISIMNTLSDFINTSSEQILLMKSLGATKWQIFRMLIFPANISGIVTTMKMGIGMSLVGVITGEFLVSSRGIGYQIVYGGQIFKLDLVMTGILTLSLISAGLYAAVAWLEKILTKTPRRR